MHRLLKIGVFVVTLGAGTVVWGATLHVDQSNSLCNDLLGIPTYCQIAPAIAAAQSGDEILIGAGNYPERGLLIDRDLTLQGVSPRETIIDGGAGDPRILTIVPDVIVVLRDLSLHNGFTNDSGGAIYNEGQLMLFRCRIHGNTAQVHGGGIINFGPLTIEQSTISNNQAEYGGGIKHNGGLLTIHNSTLSGNASIESGAGLSLDGDTNLSSSTIYNNNADLDMNNSGHAGGLSIGDFTWGLFTNGFPTDVLFIRVKNTIIAGNRDNSPNQGDPPHDCRGPIISEGYNLIQNTMSCTINGVVFEPYDTETTHDIYGKYPGYPLAINLGVLENYGGPTDVHALLAPNLASNTGNPTDCSPTDQRGFSRTDGQCDIGAFEILCGDGLLQGAEGCDDGNFDDTDACPASCQPGSCGDGYTHRDIEACDDANQDDTDACLTTCVAASCGDGVIQQDVEECEDGNLDDTDACTNTCRFATCGDGIVQQDVETCDDGNSDDTDACLTTCEFSSCGDGVVAVGVEPCDDGNRDNEDACLNSCFIASCGDGVVQRDVEACDLGSANGNAAEALCTANCEIPCQDGAACLTNLLESPTLPGKDEIQGVVVTPVSGSGGCSPLMTSK